MKTGPLTKILHINLHWQSRNAVTITRFRYQPLDNDIYFTYKLIGGEEPGWTENHGEPEVAARIEEEAAVRVAGARGGPERPAHQRPASDPLRPALPGTR